MSSTQKPSHRLRWFSIALMVATLLLLAIILWPIPHQSALFTVQSGQLQRTYHLEVQYPAWGVVGDPFQITARLSSVNPEVAEVPSSMGAMQVLSNDLLFDPDGIVSSPFPTTKIVSFNWTSTPQQSGVFHFSLFYSRQSMDAALKSIVEKPVWAKSFPLTVRSGLGAWKNPILFFTGCGVCLGFLLLLISGLPPRKPRR
jgi:hypothetical protein